MTYREALHQGEAFLRERGIPDSEWDAWLLLEKACGIDRNFYYMHMMEEMEQGRQEEYGSLLGMRAGRVPLQHITGEQEFMGLSFLVNSHVLIPRQDTEILVEEALKRAKPGMDVLDLCTGSGCVAVSLCRHARDLSVVASDISVQALKIAAENAKRNGANARFVRSDLFENLTGTFDLIVSNPPYIPTGEIKTLMPEVRDFEPRLALDGDTDGLSFYKRIIKASGSYLKPGGFLMFEIGHDQGESVPELMRDAGFERIEIIKDLAGHNRVVIGEKR